MSIALENAPDQRGQVLGKAVVRAADTLNLSGAVAASALGLSEASFSRLRQGAFTLAPGSKAYELAAHLVRLYRALDAIVGGDDRAAAPPRARSRSGAPGDKERPYGAWRGVG